MVIKTGKMKIPEMEHYCEKGKKKKKKTGPTE